MEGGAREALGKGSGEFNSSSSSSSFHLNGKATPTDSSLVLVNRPPRDGLSYWTCSKLCAICFVAGAVFGYALRGRVRRWASKILKKLS